MSNATAPQINFIRSLVAERLIEPAGRRSIADEIEDGMTKARASELITALKGMAKVAVQQELAVEAIQRPRPTEEGFYKTDNGEVFKVVTSQAGRLYAKLTTPSGLRYVAGAMAMLFADQKMTGEEIAAHGVANCYCVNCSSELTDPTSKRLGLGTSCGPAILGKEAYKVARASVAHFEDVIAFEAAKKAEAKARREAKKAAEAQLELV